ncbi:MAG: single-stranded-DNA-specific exonuclease [Patescibacteria group bacterium]|nr:single-stranded-DNA-specific exonuclease [Patescibacteria group bacterium]
MKKYILRDPVPQNISSLFSMYHPLLQELLYARGIDTIESAETFLNPNYDLHVHDPYLLKDMDKVVERIISAIEHNEKIAIYSDYDADGIPGAVVLHDFFKKINFTNFIQYIPLRNEEGFGLNHEAIDLLVSQGVTLLITIDCGITDVTEVANAHEHGVDVIITDHHIPGKIVPHACAIINPKQDGCEYPEKMLCGAGVIFKVIQALIQDKRIDFPVGYEKWFLDMVGLATLSDMVPLRGENRVFAYYGVKVLQKSPRQGLAKLFSLLKINQRTVSEDDIAFMITPRINAASRMGIPLDAFRLLSTIDEGEAGMLAEHLNNKNDERKGVVGSMVKEIKKKIHDRDEEMKHVLVLGNPEWKPSLLGLVANSFSDEHNRPVFLWGRSFDGTQDIEGSNGSAIIKGSCRSGGNIDIVRLMEKAKDVFVDYGGHKGAGGFSVLQDNIHTLEQKLNDAFIDLQHETETEPEIIVDKKLLLDDVNWNTYSSVEKCAPFGYENPKPTFLFENIKITDMKLFGKEKNHLELRFKNSRGTDVVSIAFFSGPEKFSVPISIGNSISMVATLEKSLFRNFPELRLRIVDIF